MMTVRELIEILETYDDNARVMIGMKQKYGTDFAMDIDCEVGEYGIKAFYGEDFRAVVLTEGNQRGAVDYEDYEEDEWNW